MYTQTVLLLVVYLTPYLAKKVLTVNPMFENNILEGWTFSDQGAMLCTTFDEVCPYYATGSSQYVRLGTGVTSSISQILKIPAQGKIKLRVTRDC